MVECKRKSSIHNCWFSFLIDQYVLSNESFVVSIQNYQRGTAENMCDPPEKVNMKETWCSHYVPQNNQYNSNTKSSGNYKYIVRSKLPTWKQGDVKCCHRKDQNKIENKGKLSIRV